MHADFYHSLYSIAGLSATQYHYIYDPSVDTELENDQVFKWVVKEPFEGQEEDRVATCHPVFVLPWGNAERIRRWFVRHDKEMAK